MDMDPPLVKKRCFGSSRGHQDCEQRFLDLFGDGCNVKVEPFVQVSGILAPPAAVDKTSLQAPEDILIDFWARWLAKSGPKLWIMFGRKRGKPFQKTH